MTQYITPIGLFYKNVGRLWRLSDCVEFNKEKRGKKRIGTTEDTKYLKFPNDSEGMSK